MVRNSLPGRLFNIKMSAGGGSSYSLGVIFVSCGIFGYKIYARLQNAPFIDFFVDTDTIK